MSDQEKPFSIREVFSGESSGKNFGTCRRRHSAINRRLNDNRSGTIWRFKFACDNFKEKFCSEDNLSNFKARNQQPGEKNPIELNDAGLVKAESVKDRKRVFLRRRETQSVRERLSTARNSTVIQIGEIAAFDGREWLRVAPWDFAGAGWIEVV